MLKVPDLHVIAVHSNPVRFRSRPRLMLEFQERMKAAGVTLWVVEATFGKRDPEVLDPHNPHHIQVQCDHELWLKEHMIDIAAAQIPGHADGIMWCDADIAFQREDWAKETLEYLQHYKAVQPFSHVIDYGPQGEVLETHKGFAYCYRMGDKLSERNRLGGWKYGGPYWHPGYAWAYRPKAWNECGGMIDRAILGAGDYHMACGLIGQVEFSYPSGVTEGYKRMCHAWQSRAEAAVERNIGYLPGAVHHYFHGHKADRKYVERWDVITGNHYDPETDVSYDRKGVLQWSTDKRLLIDQCREYFRQRNEDAG